MLEKKAYKLLDLKVIQWHDEDVLTTSGDVNVQDQIFITDETNWSQVG